MNACTETTAPALVDIVDLKWLLAGQGWHLQVERLHHDADYARSTLDFAAASHVPALRDTAARVRRRLAALALP
jgi:hypothetical protein